MKNDVGIFGPELEQGRNKDQIRKRRADLHPQDALRLRTSLRCRCVHILELSKEAYGALIICGSVWSDRNRARGPLHQPDTKVILDVLNQLTDRRPRQVQLVRRPAKSTSLRNPQKDSQGKDVIHTNYPCTEIILSKCRSLCKTLTL